MNAVVDGMKRGRSSRQLGVRGKFCLHEIRDMLRERFQLQSSCLFSLVEMGQMNHIRSRSRRCRIIGTLQLVYT
jgi:hypothetical protein